MATRLQLGLAAAWIGLLAGGCSDTNDLDASPLDVPRAEVLDAPLDGGDARPEVQGDVPGEVLGDASLDAREVPSDAPDAGPAAPRMVAVPAGEFEMGDHSGLGGEDPRHPSDELPLHRVTLDAFEISQTEVTCSQYVRFLNEARALGWLEVTVGNVRLGASGPTLILTREADPTSRVAWSDGTFRVLDDRGAHPITGVRWEGAAVYANWLSVTAGLAPCYAQATWEADFRARCYRLPTEAEWEYAAVGGRPARYPIYAWGDAVEGPRGNLPMSGDPWETGPEPHTTPVGFYDGSLRRRADHAWPGAQESYQTSNGANPLGLHDLSGNAWEWVHDWYGRDYYARSPASNPTGPTRAEASPMPDGLPYRGMRGGSWFNGPDGHARVSNRDPSYFRGPGDPDGPWFHVGIRVVLAHPAG